MQKDSKPFLFFFKDFCHLPTYLPILNGSILVILTNYTVFIQFFLFKKEEDIKIEVIDVEDEQGEVIIMYFL